MSLRGAGIQAQCATVRVGGFLPQIEVLADRSQILLRRIEIGILGGYGPQLLPGVLQAAAPDIDERQRIDRPQVFWIDGGGLSIKIGRLLEATLRIAGGSVVQQRRHISRLGRSAHAPDQWKRYRSSIP